MNLMLSLLGITMILAVLLYTSDIGTMELSNKYEKYKTGSALLIDDPNIVQEFYDSEKKYWDRRIENDEYELYDSNLDTTFCLINNKYKGVNKCSGIRVAGNFTAKHLPWYKDYSKNNIPQDETDFYKKNKSNHLMLLKPNK